MNDDEIETLTNYLRKVFATDEIVVLAHPEDDEKALVAQGQAFFARIDRDEDEGELSYSFAKDIPDAPPDEMKEYFAGIFNGRKVDLKKRKNHNDYEVFADDEFLGVLYPDEGADGSAQVFNMAILDIDLEPEEA